MQIHKRVTLIHFRSLRSVWLFERVRDGIRYLSLLINVDIYVPIMRRLYVDLMYVLFQLCVAVVVRGFTLIPFGLCAVSEVCLCFSHVFITFMLFML